MNTSIFAAEKSFDIGCPVVKWDDPNGLNFTPHHNYTWRNWDYQKCKDNLFQFTFHWSVSYRAEHMYSGLRARGLSVNFMIDDDCDENGYSKIYQCLDLKHAAWSQGSGVVNGVKKTFNTLGPGVEISYMPQLYQTDMYDAYDQKKWNVPPHDNTVGSVHGTKLRVHLPTEAQMKSLIQLAWGVSGLLDIPPVFPRDDNGNYITTVLKKPHDYKGFVNHYNIKRGKIDPCGLDVDRIESEVQARKKWGF